MSHILVRYYKKNLLDSLLVVAILVLLFILAYSFYPEAFRLRGHDVAYLEVNISGTRRAFEGEVVSGMTVLDALDASALAGNISFKYEIDKKTHELKIVTLDGYSAVEAPRNATLFLNLVRVDVGTIHSIPLNPGDRILVKLE